MNDTRNVEEMDCFDHFLDEAATAVTKATKKLELREKMENMTTEEHKGVSKRLKEATKRADALWKMCEGPCCDHTRQHENSQYILQLRSRIEALIMASQMNFPSYLSPRT